jgi:predicted ATPase
VLLHASWEVIWELDSGVRSSRTASTQGEQGSSTESRFSRRTPFVAREEELSALRALLTEALQGKGQLALIGGSAGVGKTRLAGEIGAHATALGAQVVMGRCDQRQNGLPFLPFAEILETLLDSARDADGLRAMLGQEASEIARLVPRVRGVLPDLESEFPSQLPPAQARRALFIAIGNLLARIGHARPLVLVIDDLQWADESSMLLLIYLMRRISNMRVLALTCGISVTFKPTAMGTRSGTLTLHDNAANNPQVVNLSGTGK